MNYKNKQKKLMDVLEKETKPLSTVVEMMNDYKNDSQICLTTVVFLSNLLVEKIQKEIISKLSSVDSNHYYYPNKSLHLTIKNIRTINFPPLFTENDILKAERAFSKVIPKFNKFYFNLEGLLKLPTSLAIRAYCGKDVKKIVDDLDSTLNKIGLPDNKKYMSKEVFWGNVTFCRFTGQPSKDFLKIVENLKNIKIGKLEVEKIFLITTNSVCYPSKTRVIKTYKLLV